LDPRRERSEQRILVPQPYRFVPYGFASSRLTQIKQLRLLFFSQPIRYSSVLKLVGLLYSLSHYQVMNHVTVLMFDAGRLVGGGLRKKGIL